MVDLVASEYGWGKDEILNNLYIDELFYLVANINKRKASEYLMQLSIVTNPHITDKSDRKLLWDSLQEHVKEPRSEQLDKEGMMRLKNIIMGSGSKIAVK